MPYLICKKCNLSYEIEHEEEMNDFNTCNCGNKLVYYNTIEEYLYSDIADSDIGVREKQSMYFGKTHADKMAIKYTITTFFAAIFAFIASFSKSRSAHRESRKILNKERRKGHNWRKGSQGERTVANELERLPENYHIFHDITIPRTKGNIDHIVIGKNGIFVIETKNYNVTTRVNGDKWIFYGKRVIKPKNHPGKQVSINVIRVKDFLRDFDVFIPNSGIHGIVAFMGKIYIDKPPKYYDILRPEQLYDFIITYKGDTDTDQIKNALDLFYTLKKYNRC